MEKENKRTIVAKILTSTAKNALSVAANSRCAMLYHQPKQPLEVKKFRKF